VSTKVEHNQNLRVNIHVSAFPARVRTVVGNLFAKQTSVGISFGIHLSGNQWWLRDPGRCPFAKAFKTLTRRNILRNGNANCRFTQLQVSACSLYSAEMWYDMSLKVQRTS
jgi:hypothetical protein